MTWGVPHKSNETVDYWQEYTYRIFYIAPQALSFPISYTNYTNNEQYFWNNHYPGSRS